MLDRKTTNIQNLIDQINFEVARIQKVRLRSENESKVFKTPTEAKEIVEQRLMKEN